MKRHVMPLFATLDVGTNSVKLHISELQPDGSWSTVVDRSAVTRLGEGLRQTGEFSPRAMARSTAAIADMVAEAQRCGVRAIAAVGTMGLRTARNRDRFLHAVEERCGIMIEVITGAEEARLGYLAVQASFHLRSGRLAIFDTGGGSTQFTLGSPTAIDEHFSVDLGAVRLTEQFRLHRPVTTGLVQQTIDTIAAEFSRLDAWAPAGALVGMGGTVTNLAAVKLGLAAYNPDAVQGAVLDATEVDGQIELYRSRDAEARKQIIGLDPRRVDVILAGACVVRTVMRKLRQDRLTVSDRGLRHGLLIERFGGTGTGDLGFQI